MATIDLRAALNGFGDGLIRGSGKFNAWPIEGEPTSLCIHLVEKKVLSCVSGWYCLGADQGALGGAIIQDVQHQRRCHAVLAARTMPSANACIKLANTRFWVSFAAGLARWPQ